jgi:hypothetical protein
MTSLSSEPDDDDVEDEQLLREVERLLEFWDEEPAFEKWKRGGSRWS